jgi:hypothetical protein
MSFKKRFLDSTDKDEVYDDVSEKKAIPELILKRDIFEAESAMLLAERVLMNNFRRYGKFFDDDKINFEGNIILLFGFIKYMIIDAKIKPVDKLTYFKMLRLESGARLPVPDLILLKNFLLSELHVLNLANLFVSNGSGWKKDIEDE